MTTENRTARHHTTVHALAVAVSTVPTDWVISMRTERKTKLVAAEFAKAAGLANGVLADADMTLSDTPSDVREAITRIQQVGSGATTILGGSFFDQATLASARAGTALARLIVNPPAEPQRIR